MPELPEVETCCQGLKPHILYLPIKDVIVRETRLRWPITAGLIECLKHQQFTHLTRRAKYLLFTTTNQQTLLVHLGMSGKLRVVPENTPIIKHDHVDIIFSNGMCLRYNDARRFGAILLFSEPMEQHPLLASLGIEPLEEIFNADYLHQKIKNKKQAIKLVIMDSHIVVGIGNIYANEALYAAHIHPHRPANSLTMDEISALVSAIKQILRKAIAAGGTTLRDFISVEGKPGYFKQQLAVYGKTTCLRCNQPLSTSRLGQRITIFCELCQPKPV